MHHMAKDTHVALANIKCTLTKERNKQQAIYCVRLFLIGAWVL